MYMYAALVGWFSFDSLLCFVDKVNLLTLIFLRLHLSAYQTSPDKLVLRQTRVKMRLIYLEATILGSNSHPLSPFAVEGHALEKQVTP